MFFTKSRRLTRQLTEATQLVKRATRLASPYLYDKGHRPTAAELALLEGLRDTCYQAYAYTSCVSSTLQERSSPEAPASVPPPLA